MSPDLRNKTSVPPMSPSGHCPSPSPSQPSFLKRPPHMLPLLPWLPRPLRRPGRVTSGRPVSITALLTPSHLGLSPALRTKSSLLAMTLASACPGPGDISVLFHAPPHPILQIHLPTSFSLALGFHAGLVLCPWLKTKTKTKTQTNKTHKAIAYLELPCARRCAKHGLANPILHPPIFIH